MNDNDVSAQGADPEVVTEAEVAEGQVQDQTAETGEAEADPAEEERKSRAKERRERHKAYQQRLQDDLAEARRQAESAEARRQKVLEAGRRFSEPTEADYQDPTELAAARAIWRHTRMMHQADEEQATSEVQSARQQADQIAAAQQRIVDASWNEAVEDAKTRYSDFDAVARAETLPVSPAMAQIIQASDVGPDVLYHLGMNPELAAQISRMHPVEAARAIGRIEAAVSTGTRKSVTAAPPPVTPVKGASAAGKRPSEMTPAEYRAWREAGGKL